MKKILFILVIELLIGCLLVSSYYIYKHLNTNIEQKQLFEELKEVVEQCEDIEDNLEEQIEDSESNITEYKIENVEKKEKNLRQLYKLNNDFIGWLSIDNTSINYPVMQIINKPNYYLYKDFYKRYSQYGTPYMSEQCNLNNSDNFVIYGHHIKNKSMFGALEYYKNKSFYDNHKYINFKTLQGNKKYKIFSVFKTVAYSNNGFKYYDYINLQNEADFYSFVSKCKELSVYETNCIPKYGDKLITLSTCEYSNKNGRLVVVGYEIK